MNCILNYALTGGTNRRSGTGAVYKVRVRIDLASAYYSTLIKVEAPRRKEGLGQCHRCQRYGHAAAYCDADPRCVKCLDPYWTRECPRTRESSEKFVNCGQNHTANYRECPKASKITPKLNKRTEKIWPSRRNQPLRAVSGPPRETARLAPPLPPPTVATTDLSQLFGEDIQMVMSVLRTIKSLEIFKFAQDLRACRNIEDKLIKIPSSDSKTQSCSGASSKSSSLQETPSSFWTILIAKTPGRAVHLQNIIEINSTDSRTDLILKLLCLLFLPDTTSKRPSTLDIVVTKEGALNLGRIETVHCLLSDHRSVLLKMKPPDGGSPNPTLKITDWERVLTAPEKIDTPFLNSILVDINTTNEIDLAISAFTNHVRSGREKQVEGFGVLGSPEPSCQRFRADKSKKCSVAPRKPIVSNHIQCSHASPPPDIAHIQHIEEEVQNKASFELKDDLLPVSLSDIQTLAKSLKTKKAPSLDCVSNKAIKCFSLPLLGLLVAIFNVWLKNCYFPSVWKEAEVTANHKPGKPRNLPASYRPISLLSGLGELFDRILKTRLSDDLLRKGLIIDE
ncbi:Probable RNA-directed DNA polymerase from transposon X-element [Eumeta japonica]|uniref:Probable RNA-directed DNA polymerase from transposon X-element n=1 Tax=Eumeta variegata TaxID=151549 RepID=A0A4C1WAU1_EUMVA|nr:Probable RNA-directed DNA polymerase from transposon X-element [Eumeta japonica]